MANILLQTRAAKGFVALSGLFLTVFVPVVLLARKETYLVRHPMDIQISRWKANMHSTLERSVLAYLPVNNYDDVAPSEPRPHPFRFEAWHCPVACHGRA
jgi:hypothetical protein